MQSAHLLLLAVTVFVTIKTLKCSIVCQGGRFMTSCSTNTMSHRWTIVEANQTGSHRMVGVFQEAPYPSPNRTTTKDGVTFQFSKISSSPLVSTMLVENVTSNANETGVYCDDGSTNITAITFNVITSGKSVLT